MPERRIASLPAFGERTGGAQGNVVELGEGLDAEALGVLQALLGLLVGPVPGRALVETAADLEEVEGGGVLEPGVELDTRRGSGDQEGELGVACSYSGFFSGKPQVRVSIPCTRLRWDSML